MRYINPFNVMDILRREVVAKYGEINDEGIEDRSLSSLVSELMKDKITKQECDLKTLNIFDCSFFMNRKQDAESMKQFSKALTVFLKSQQHLESLKIRIHAKFYEVWTLNNSLWGKSMKTLWFEFDLNWHPRRRNLELYYGMVKNMENLEELLIPFTVFNCTLLRLLTENCKCLKMIRLTFQPQIRHRSLSESGRRFLRRREAISTSEWIKARNLLPKLRVELVSEFSVDGYYLVPKWFVPAMPLTEIDMLRIVCGTVPDQEWDSLRMLYYIAGSFFNTLETFGIADEHGELDDGIMRMLANCSKLRKLTVKGVLSLATVEKICKMQQDNKIDLKEFYLFIYDVAEEENKKLRKLLDKYKKVLGLRHWNFCRL